MIASRTTSKRTRIAAGLATALAALAVAAPAQAELVGGVRDGGCLRASRSARRPTTTAA